MCINVRHAYDVASNKGLFLRAFADLSAATGATTYDPFLIAQAKAVLADSATDGKARTRCQNPHACQLDFYWSRKVMPSRLPIETTVASQESGLEALAAGMTAAESSQRRRTLGKRHPSTGSPRRPAA